MILRQNESIKHENVETTTKKPPGEVWDPHLNHWSAIEEKYKELSRKKMKEGCGAQEKHHTAWYYFVIIIVEELYAPS